MKTPQQRREAAIRRLPLTPEQRKAAEHINRKATRQDKEDEAARNINRD